MEKVCRTCRSWGPSLCGKQNVAQMGRCYHKLIDGMDSVDLPDNPTAAFVDDGGCLVTGPQYYCPHYEQQDSPHD